MSHICTFFRLCVHAGTILRKGSPPERDAAALGAVLLGPHKAPLVPPPIHAAQHERAGRKGDDHTRPALPPASPGGAASGYGHLTRSRPQGHPSSAAAPQWEPRKPLGGTRSPAGAWTPAGLKVRVGLTHCRATHELQPFRSVTQANSAQEKPQHEAGARSQSSSDGGRCGLLPRPGSLAFRPTPARPGR